MVMLLGNVGHVICGVIVGGVNTTLKVQKGEGQFIILVINFGNTVLQ